MMPDRMMDPRLQAARSALGAATPDPMRDERELDPRVRAAIMAARMMFAPQPTDVAGMLGRRNPAERPAFLIN